MVANIISGSLIFATALLFGALGGMLSERRRHQLRCGRFHDFWGFFSAIGANFADRWGWAGSAHG